MNTAVTQVECSIHRTLHICEEVKNRTHPKFSNHVYANIVTSKKTKKKLFTDG